MKRGKKLTVSQIKELKAAGIIDPENWLLVKTKVYGSDGSTSLKKKDDTTRIVTIANKNTSELREVRVK